MATENEKFPSFARLKRFCKNLPWQRMRKAMGLGDTLGALPPECGGTGTTGSLQSVMGLGTVKISRTYLLDQTKVLDVLDNSTLYMSDSSGIMELEAPSIIGSNNGFVQVENTTLDGDRPASSHLKITKPGIYSFKMQTKYTLLDDLTFSSSGQDRFYTMSTWLASLTKVGKKPTDGTSYSGLGELRYATLSSPKEIVNSGQVQIVKVGAANSDVTTSQSRGTINRMDNTKGTSMTVSDSTNNNSKFIISTKEEIPLSVIIEFWSISMRNQSSFKMTNTEDFIQVALDIEITKLL